MQLHHNVTVKSEIKQLTTLKQLIFIRNLSLYRYIEAHIQDILLF